MPDSHVGVYRERSDGDWEFVACFALDTMPEDRKNGIDGRGSAKAAAMSIAFAIVEDGDRATLIEGGEPDDFPSIWYGPVTSTISAAHEPR